MIVPNNDLHGENCSKCVGRGWRVEARALFFVTDGTTDGFILEVADDELLELMGLRLNGVAEVRKLVRMLRLFSIGRANRYAGRQVGQ